MSANDTHLCLVLALSCGGGAIGGAAAGIWSGALVLGLVAIAFGAAFLAGAGLLSRRR